MRVSELEKAVLHYDWAWLSSHGVLYGPDAEVIDAAEQAARHELEFQERSEGMKLLSVEKSARRSRRVQERLLPLRSDSSSASKLAQCVPWVTVTPTEHTSTTADGVLVEASFAAR